jgi:uncharacterized protein YuzE
MAMNARMKAPTDLKVTFDSDADVLYISKGEPVPSHVDELHADELPDGVLLRHAYSDGNASGITALDFRANWFNRTSDFASLVADYLHVSTALARHEIEQAI